MNKVICTGKYIFGLIATVVLSAVLLLGGCSSNGDKNVKQADKTAKGNRQNAVMNIYIPSIDNKTINAIEEFNSTNSVKIKPIMLENEDQGKQYREKIVAAIVSGDGPDIILDNAQWFPALWKMAGNKAFQDFDELIKKDEEFKLEDYRESVMNAGIVNGKRYFLPLGFDIPLFWTTKNLAKQNGIQIDDSNFTWNDFEKLASKSIGKSGKESKKYFVGLDFSFADIFRSSWLKWIDLKNKKTNFTSDEFISLLEMYKRIYSTICPNEEIWKYTDYHFGLLKNNSLILVDGNQLTAPEQLWTDNSIADRYLDSEIEISPYPTIDVDDKYSSQISRFAAIGIYSKYKNEAFSFIKLLLSDKYQASNIVDSYSLAPVKKLSFEKMIKKYTGEAGGSQKITWNQKEYRSVSIPQELTSRINKYINAVDFELMDSNIVEIVDLEVKAYISGKQHAKQTAAAIDQKVTLYLNE